MVKLTQRGPVTFLESEELSQFPSILHGFCTRIGGVSGGPYATLNVSPREGDPPEQVRMNWQRLAAAFGIPCEQFFVVNQVHGESFLVIEDAASCHSLEDRQYDAIVTDRPGVAIGIKTADCAPVLIFDRRRQAIAAVHAGWRGTALAIAAKAVRVMGERFSSRPEDLLAVIGPSIGACCYEVDEPVFEAHGPSRVRGQGPQARAEKGALDVRSAARQPDAARAGRRAPGADIRCRALHLLPKGPVLFAPPGRGNDGTAPELHPAFAGEIALDKGGGVGVNTGHLKKALNDLPLSNPTIRRTTR